MKKMRLRKLGGRKGALDQMKEVSPMDCSSSNAASVLVSSRTLKLESRELGRRTSGYAISAAGFLGILDSISCESLSTSSVVRISLKTSGSAGDLVGDVQRIVNMACASLQLLQIVCSSMPESLNNRCFRIVGITRP
jgi:hypothetical protein